MCYGCAVYIENAIKEEEVFDAIKKSEAINSLSKIALHMKDFELCSGND